MRDLSNQYAMEIQINQRGIPEYPHTDGYTYVEGREGSEYSVVLTNNSYSRVCFVLAVDGLSVLTGDHDWSTGLIAEPRGTVKVDGWRIDNSHIAKFEFSDVRKSYSNSITGNTATTGVIGVMVFQEAPPLPYMGTFSDPIFRSVNQVLGNSAVFSAVSPTVQTTASAALGTGWGDQAGASYKNATFTRRDENNPDALLTLYYDSAKGLDKRGVVRPDKLSRYNPSPFPGYGSGLRGCTPPR